MTTITITLTKEELIAIRHDIEIAISEGISNMTPELLDKLLFLKNDDCRNWV